MAGLKAEITRAVSRLAVSVALQYLFAFYRIAISILCIIISSRVNLHLDLTFEDVRTICSFKNPYFLFDF